MGALIVVLTVPVSKLIIVNATISVCEKSGDMRPRSYLEREFIATRLHSVLQSVPAKRADGEVRAYFQLTDVLNLLGVPYTRSGIFNATVSTCERGGGQEKIV